MCGIVGYVGNKPVVPLIIDGLRKLEYRGYDSAGIAVVNGDHELQIRRAEGKLRNLEAALQQNPLSGTYGVGHTRWATHGRPTEENAHPHRDCTGRVIVVHNGIIENYLKLKEELRAKDHEFVTETDTEIVAHLIEEFLKQGADFESAVRQTVERLTGIFALSIICSDYPDTIISARQGPPVVMGLGDGEFFVASDVPAILEHTRDVFFLADGEIAVMTKDGIRVTDFEGKEVQPEQQRITWDPIQVEKGGFKHFMLKEIYEQPRAVRETVEGRISHATGRVFLDQMRNISEDEFRRFDSIKNLPMLVGSLAAAIKQDPRRIDARLLLARGLIIRRDFIEAESLLHNLETALPNSAIVRAQLGMLHLAKNNRAAALTEFNRALALDPRQIDAIMGLVGLDLASSRQAEALARLKAAIVQAPDDAEAPSIFRDAIERAYAAKYGATQKFVRGFRSKGRRDTTLEFVPR